MCSAAIFFTHNSAPEHVIGGVIVFLPPTTLTTVLNVTPYLVPALCGTIQLVHAGPAKTGQFVMVREV